jgi:alpha-glucosidase
VPAVRDGHFELPLYARAGAIIPVAYVDDATMNVLGRRSDGTRHDELRARIYASTAPTSFTLFEDDGVTIGYQSGEVRTTELSQVEQAAAATRTVTIKIAGARGSYTNAPAQRDAVLDVCIDGGATQAVTLDGAPLPALDRQAALPGWIDLGNGVVRIETGALPVERDKTIVVTTTLRGH